MIRLAEHNPRLLVVGDLIVDHYVMGEIHRISPEAPVPIVQVRRERNALGGTGNVISNLLALGATVVPASVVGNDSGGRQLLDMLDQRGVSLDGILVEKDKRTSRKTRVVVGQQQVVRLDDETTLPIASRTEANLIRVISHQRDPFDAIVISDYNKGVVTPAMCRAVIAYAHRNSIPVLVDPKGTDGDKYHGATVMTPNRGEAYGLTGVRVSDDSSLRAVGARLRQQFDLEYAVITLSDEGLAVCGEQMTRIHATAKEVYDVSGAGDTVLAVLSYGLACGIPIAEASRLANLAAGVVVSKSGTATVTWEEIARQQQQHSDSGCERSEKPIVSAEDIDRVARQLRASGKRIVFTNGCFDILHRGHVEYLRASRALGDVLVVGVNSDASIRRIKGPGRPVIGEEDRVAMLIAIRDVDYVIPFHEDTPYDLIRRLQPHVITKGADYERHEVVGNELVDEVRLIPLVGDRSTSRTIQRIREAA